MADVRTRELAPLPPTQAQRLAGWIRMLDVDLDAAQAALRLPPAAMPLPPLALPAVLDWDGVTVLAPAVEAPSPEEAAEPLVVAPAAPALRGAYARRARS